MEVFKELFQAVRDLGSPPMTLPQLRLLRHIVDPVATSFADAYSSRHDLISHARRNGIVAFDNLGRLTPCLAHFINSLAGGMSVEVRAPRDPHAPAAVGAEPKPRMLGALIGGNRAASSADSGNAVLRSVCIPN
jgi:hypothetical protein